MDNRPLQAAAWADLTQARRKLEKATTEIHRHEQTDQPTFTAWLAATFPTLVSTARDLAQQVQAKGQVVSSIESEAYFTGKSPASIWRSRKQRGHGGTESRDTEPPPREKASGFSEEDSSFDEEMRRFFEEMGRDGRGPFGQAYRDAQRHVAGREHPTREPADIANIRAIYRRLVQHLHPDRGGQWTPARAKLWEQVQSAWSERDGDWLARLEAEWEAAADLLGPTSALGRLRAALGEILAARRDADRRVREYRKHIAWRFSIKGPVESLRQRLQRDLTEDCATLRDQLAELEATIARWERPKVRRFTRRRLEAMWQDDMPLY